jgi:hypothetical protein
VFGVVIGIHNARDNAAIEARTALNDQSIKSLNDANTLLRNAGLPQVPVPQNGDAVTTANAIAQAAAALVLADPRFAGLTLADLRRQVDDYFREHPLPEGQKPTPDQVIQAVTTICSDGACKGRPPTPAEIASAVSAYCANDACRGEPGPGPTQSQIDASVDRYCGQSPSPCASTVPGPQGPQGQQGQPGVAGQPGRDAPRPTGTAGFLTDPETGDCLYVVPYDDGSQVVARTQPGFCETPPEPTTSTPTPLPTEGN